LSAQQTQETQTQQFEFDFDIGGMTCASCAARVEKKLNRLEGVQASVNFATERAHVTAPETVSQDELIATVQKTGYEATPLPGENTQTSTPTRPPQ
jgi:Cu+-exporting ATPase